MKTIQQYCFYILNSPLLSDKLIPPPQGLEDDPSVYFSIPNLPQRENKIQFSLEKTKIPRLEHLNSKTNRALAMHHFANHELMALEIFAWAILSFPNIPKNQRAGLFKTLLDEQRHLQLYIDRIQELGIEFGDRPINSLFWKFTALMNTFEKFSAVMSLSFEGANLDFTLIYRAVFLQYEDFESAEIIETIHRDEIGHVKKGLSVLEKNLEESPLSWNTYLSLLDYPFTPRRAKGYFYIPETRRSAGLSEDFINKLALYRDEFSNRKKEKIPENLKDCGIFTG